MILVAFQIIIFMLQDCTNALFVRTTVDDNFWTKIFLNT